MQELCLMQLRGDMSGTSNSNKITTILKCLHSYTKLTAAIHTEMSAKARAKEYETAHM